MNSLEPTTLALRELAKAQKQYVAAREQETGLRELAKNYREDIAKAATQGDDETLASLARALAVINNRIDRWLERADSINENYFAAKTTLVAAVGDL